MATSFRLLVALLFLPGAAAGQIASIIEDPVSCTSCRIAAHVLARISIPASHPVDLARLLYVARRGDGGYVVQATSDGRSMVLAGPTGVFERFVDTPHWNGRLVSRTDGAIQILLRGESRVLRGQEVGPSSEEPGVAWSAVDLGGAWVYNGYLAEDTAAASPLYMVTSEGNARPLAEPFSVPAWNISGHQVHRGLTRSSDGGFWTLEPTSYRIVEWNETGLPVRVFEVASDWPDDEPTAFAGWDTPPAAIPSYLSADRSGLLWVIGQLPDAAWRPLDVPDARDPLPDPSSVYDSMIEVIDPRRGIVVARGRYDLRVLGFVGERDVWGVRQDESGRTVVQIVRLRMTDPTDTVRSPES
ncbi:MAG: hypothetical protein WEB88_03555 [Gemmatimonadota bacterium]